MQPNGIHQAERRWYLRQRSLFLFLLAASGTIAMIVVGVHLACSIASGRQRAADQAIWLHKVVSSVRAYYEVKGYLPEATIRDDVGRPLSSWRAAVAWVVYGPPPRIYLRLPWDAPENRHAAELSPPLFCLAQSGDPSERLWTNALAVTGPGTAFDGTEPRKIEDLPYDVILFVEVAHSGVHWMAPGDLDIDSLPQDLTGGVDGTGVCVAFADSEVWFLRHDVPMETLKTFFTVEGAANHDRAQLLGQYLVFHCQ